MEKYNDRPTIHFLAWNASARIDQRWFVIVDDHHACPGVKVVDKASSPQEKIEVKWPLQNLKGHNNVSEAKTLLLQIVKTNHLE